MLKNTSTKTKLKTLAPSWRSPSVFTGYGGEHQHSYTLR